MAFSPIFLRWVLWYLFFGTPFPSRVSSSFWHPYFVRKQLHVLFRNGEASSPRGGVSLALGGGFARGYAHLGVLQAFEENEIPVTSIAGSSIGSILGAAYASGAPLPQIIQKCRGIRFRDFAKWRVSRFGLASNERLGALVQKIFGTKQFED